MAPATMTLVRMLSPFAPFTSAELLEMIGNDEVTIENVRWPEYDESVLAAATVPCVVQVNGKLRDTIQVTQGLPKDELERIARANPECAQAIFAQTGQSVFDSLEIADDLFSSRSPSGLFAFDGSSGLLLLSKHELKNTQAQLIHSEKMASLGQLVAGISHELNNPIGFIYANVKQLKSYTDKIDKFTRSLDLKTSELGQEDGMDISALLPDLKNLINDTIHGSQMVKNLVDNM